MLVEVDLYSRATATNVYLMFYPKPALAKVLLDQAKLLKEVWYGCDHISGQTLMGEGRAYGSNIHKLEPGELGNATYVEILKVYQLGKIFRLIYKLRLLIKILHLEKNHGHFGNIAGN